jgi:hypothetical protein
MRGIEPLFILTEAIKPFLFHAGHGEDHVYSAHTSHCTSRIYTVLSGEKECRNSNFIKSIKIGRRARIDLIILNRRIITKIYKNYIVSRPVSENCVVLKQIGNPLSGELLWYCACSPFHSKFFLSNFL